MRRVFNLFIGSVLAATIASSSFAQSDPMNRSRAVAMHDCNVRASAYTQYTWGDWQLYVYRACMAEQGQIE